MASAPLLVTEEHVSYALATLVEDGVLPDDFIPRFKAAAEKTREMALTDLKRRDDAGPLYVVCAHRDGGDTEPPEDVFVELEDVFGASHGPDMLVEWRSLPDVREGAGDYKALGPFVSFRYGGVAAHAEVERLLEKYPKVTRGAIAAALKTAVVAEPAASLEEADRAVEELVSRAIGDVPEGVLVIGMKDAGDALEHVFGRVFEEHITAEESPAAIVAFREHLREAMLEELVGGDRKAAV